MNPRIPQMETNDKREPFVGELRERLRRSEERFRDLYENAPLAYFSVSMDGHIRTVNGIVERLLGYVGMTLSVAQLCCNQSKSKGKRFCWFTTAPRHGVVWSGPSTVKISR